MVDAGNSGTDTIGFTIVNGNGALYYSNNYVTGKTVPQTLGGGNLSIH
jgi:hypothetical protein